MKKNSWCGILMSKWYVHVFQSLVPRVHDSHTPENLSLAYPLLATSETTDYYGLSIIVAYYFPYAGKALGDGWSICLWTRGSTSNVCLTLDISLGSYHDINAILKYKSYLFWHTHMYVHRIIIVHGRSIQSSLRSACKINSAATSSIWWCNDFACDMQAHAYHYSCVQVLHTFPYTYTRLSVTQNRLVKLGH